MWVAILEVVDGPFEDDSPRFADGDDPFVTRFHVRPLVMLSEEGALPIKDGQVWTTLSFTRDHDPRSSKWTGRLRGSLNRLPEEDGRFLERMLLARTTADDSIPGPIEETATPDTGNSVQGSSESQSSPPLGTEGRESIRVQASLAEIGSRMGLDVWVPPSDRGRVEQHLGDGVPLLDRLPLSYNEVTNKTIEQIDVLWLRGRSIVRAFEVEHTTAVYSGLLRMADLLALQPNMEIRLHIVAPSERRSKVLQEIRRPVFERLEGRPLAARCTYISYEKLQDLHRIPHLAHLSDTVLSEYEERAQ